MEMERKLSDGDAIIAANDALQKYVSMEQVENSVRQLEKYVRSGLFYQAAELSDWIAFAASRVLKKNISLMLRYEVERLKRFDNLGFRRQAEIIRDEFCAKHRLDEVIGYPANHGNNEIKFHLFTAIGHTLWFIDDVADFKQKLSVCEELHNGTTDDYSYKTVSAGFLEATKGRQSYLQGESYHEVMKHFEDGLSLLNDELRKSRFGLHIINQYLTHLVSMYESGNHEAELINKIEQLFTEFSDNGLSHIDPKGAPRPLKSILEIDFLSKVIRKSRVDLKLARQNGLEKSEVEKIEKRIEGARMELYFTSIMLGLGNLNPGSPKLVEVQQYFEENDLYASNQIEEYLKRVLGGIGWEGMEEIVKIYFKCRNFKVIELPSGAPVFDLLLEFQQGGGSYEDYAGVQVKSGHKKFLKRDFEEWISKLRDFANNPQFKNYQITMIYLYTRQKPNDQVSLLNQLDLLRNSIPTLRREVKFVCLNEIAEELSRHPGYWPEVHNVISM